MTGARKRRVTLESRVSAFRELVQEAISKAEARGQRLRPYDGAVSLYWPSTVHTSRNRYCTLRLSCSVFEGETSHFSWRGRSWRSVFAHASQDVQSWTEDMDAPGGDK
jgi:hypothetical protein